MIYLIDVDGVLIDNLDFEQEVIKNLKKYMINNMSLDEYYVADIIQNELETITNSKEDYSYEAMCKNIGIINHEIWKEAHHLSIKKLKTFHNTEAFLKNITQKSKNKIFFVTDAVEWVLHFKLNAVLFDYKEIQSFYQENTNSFKGEEKYWKIMKHKFKNMSINNEPVVYIDNRNSRLYTASKIIDNMTTVLIRRKEHLQNFQKKSENLFAPSLEVDSLSQIPI